MITDELERAKMDVETEKIEIQARAAGGKKYGPKEGAELEIQIAEMKADKSVVTMQVRTHTLELCIMIQVLFSKIGRLSLYQEKWMFLSFLQPFVVVFAMFYLWYIC